jgi:release factor H-coupled RctB family protein
MFVIDELYDERTKIDPKQVYFLIHSGSGTMGFNTSSKFSKLYSNASETNGFNKKYLESFKKVRSFAKSNREELRKLVQRGVSRAVGFDVEYNPIFDKPHNDIEVSNNGSLRYKLMKGTSQLKPGELFVIPGTCVSPAYVVKGLRGLENSHFTINHGSGRKYTRAQIFSKFRRRDFSDLFKGVVLNVPSKKMIEEIPKGYKNIEDVIASVEDAKLVKKVAKLRPVGVVVERK